MPSACRLSQTLVPLETRYIQAMFFKPAFTFSSVYPLGVLLCTGLRLWALRQFQAFLAANAYWVRANSYHFASIVPPRWRSAFPQFAPVVKLGFPVLASGSNCSSQPTAYGGG